MLGLGRRGLIMLEGVVSTDFSGQDNSSRYVES